MANEKEVKELETLIESMKTASNNLVKVYPTASLTLKYMSDDINIIVADLKGRKAAGGESAASGVVLPGIARPFTQQEMNAAQAKIFGRAL
jgi:hypothetical protein